MRERDISDETSLHGNTQEIRDIDRIIRLLMSLGTLHSRDDVIRYLKRYDGFDIIGVTDSGMTICASDKKDDRITLTGYFYSSSFTLSG
ncbi:hypothetical protein [Klebsiella sp. BIGb0407]|uniref:hypothetical protein n=1 Tax=Klebsiella sp. BIGb0407 TaxID=2940603 RepID=UPI0021699F7D|nr:hypothetical protein [Klebsiella sp. BIGb0407]MCS3434249.1 hypothetical protein [Klebsiella sp. BIGb0407]